MTTKKKKTRRSSTARKSKAKPKAKSRKKRSSTKKVLHSNPRRFVVKRTSKSKSKKGKYVCKDKRTGKSVTKRGSKKSVSSYCQNLAKRSAKPAYRSRKSSSRPAARANPRANPTKGSAKLTTRVTRLENGFRTLAKGHMDLVETVHGMSSGHRPHALGSGRR